MNQLVAEGKGDDEVLVAYQPRWAMEEPITGAISLHEAQKAERRYGADAPNGGVDTGESEDELAAREAQEDEQPDVLYLFLGSGSNRYYQGPKSGWESGEDALYQARRLAE